MYSVRTLVFWPCMAARWNSALPTPLPRADSDKVFGVYNERLELVGVGHLAYLRDNPQGRVAEFGEVANAHQLQALIIDAEDLVVVEVDAVDVRFDDVIAHHLAETQQAVFLAQCEQVFEQARPVVRSKLAHQHGGTRRTLRGFRLVDVVLGDDADGLAQFERVHDNVSYSVCALVCGATG